MVIHHDEESRIVVKGILVLSLLFLLVLAGCKDQVILKQPGNVPIAVMDSNATCKYTINDDGAYLPDPKCSPGKAFPLTTLQIKGEYAKQPGGVIVGDICVSGYSKNIRSVSQKTKDKVYALYGITRHDPYEYEIDHIIPLSIGGTNDVENLYPQPATPVPGYKQKDVIENCFHRRVCDGSLNIADAQAIIASDWTLGFKICGITQ